MLKLKLKPTLHQRKAGYPWAACSPFVDNDRAQLVHRPANVTTYKIHAYPHTAIQFLCGNSTSSSKDIYHFSDTIDGTKLLCQRCEDAAVRLGMPSADDLCGGHVHKGKLVPVQVCCIDEVK